MLLKHLKKNELKRSNKEKSNEKQILIRDLFKKVRKRLCQELQKKNLSNIGLKIIFNSGTDCIKLSWSSEVSSKFGAYQFLVFGEILAVNSNPSIFDYAGRDSSPY